MENNSPKFAPEAPLPKTVCGRKMTADVVWYPQARYQNRTIYFCTEFCLDAFEADPDRFYTAHREKQVPKRVTIIENLP
jgi:YHS domain-containing protein